MPANCPSLRRSARTDRLDRSRTASSSSCSRPTRSPARQFPGAVHVALDRRQRERLPREGRGPGCGRSAALHRGDPERRRARTWRCTSFNPKWPFDVTQSPTRMNEEFTFFDDMLACVEQQYPVNQDCVSTVGVSAGALFTDSSRRRAANARVVPLAVGRRRRHDHQAVDRRRRAKLPGVVLWGGDGPPHDGRQQGHPRVRRHRDGLLGRVVRLETRTRAGRPLLHRVQPQLRTRRAAARCPARRVEVRRPVAVRAQPSVLAAGRPVAVPRARPAADMPAWCGIGANSATPRSGGGCPAAENPCVE